MTYIHTPDPFANFDKFFVGTEHLSNQFKKLTEQAKDGLITSNYPPYNIRKLEDNKYLIEMAVAGFTDDDIDITLAESKLTIKGKQETLDSLTKDGINQTYIHRGLANRAFTRVFTLAEDVVVSNVTLEHGMLKIYLEHVIPDTKKPVKININGKAPTSKKEFLAEDDPFNNVR